MKIVKRILSIIMSICMLMSITAGISLNANAATSTKDKVISSNISKIKRHIKNNGFVSGAGNYTIQMYDYTDDLDFYYLMFIDSDTDELNFQLNVEDSSSEELISVIVLDASTSDTIRYDVAVYYNYESDYPVIGAHAYVGENYHDSLDNAAFYIDYNESNISNSFAINWFSTLNQCAFSGWNDMLINEMGLNLGAIGYAKYCTSHEWTSYKATKKATTSSTGKKTCHCEICGKTKSKTISKNSFSVKGLTKTVSYSTVKKKNASVKRSNAINVKNAKGNVTYKKKSANKKITVAKNGTITVKKGIKKGTYKVKIGVTASGNSSYSKSTKTVTVTIKVK